MPSETWITIAGFWSETKHSHINPLRTAVPFWGQNTRNSSSLSPKRECGSKRVNMQLVVKAPFESNIIRVCFPSGLDILFLYYEETEVFDPTRQSDSSIGNVRKSRRILVRASHIYTPTYDTTSNKQHRRRWLSCCHSCYCSPRVSVLRPYLRPSVARKKSSAAMASGTTRRRTPRVLSSHDLRRRSETAACMRGWAQLLEEDPSDPTKQLRTDLAPAPPFFLGASQSIERNSLLPLTYVSRRRQ